MGQRLLRGDRKGLENPKLPEVLGGSLGFLLCCPFQIFFSNFLTLEKSSWDSDVERVWSFFALHLLYAIWTTSVNIILMKHSGSQVGWYPWCSNLRSNKCIRLWRENCWYVCPLATAKVLYYLGLPHPREAQASKGCMHRCLTSE